MCLGEGFGWGTETGGWGGGWACIFRRQLGAFVPPGSGHFCPEIFGSPAIQKPERPKNLWAEIHFSWLWLICRRLKSLNNGQICTPAGAHFCPEVFCVGRVFEYAFLPAEPPFLPTERQRVQSGGEASGGERSDASPMGWVAERAGRGGGPTPRQ